MRIVSLLSSATEIVYLLGLQDSLVAISHECDFPPGALDRPRASRIRFDPRAMSSAEIDAEVRRCMELHGSVYEVDTEMLRRLRPDLVLTQAVCEVCAVPTGSVRDAIADLPRPPAIASLDAHTIADILTSIHQVADAAGESACGVTAVAALEDRLTRVADAVAGQSQPRALLLEWLDPPFAPGHWVPEMVTRAGGECLLGETGKRSRQIAWTEAEGLDPDILLIEPCGYDLAGARADADRARDRLQTLAPEAIASGRAWVLDSALFSRSGPRVVDGVETLARVLHPRIWPEAHANHGAARWQ